ncbi:MULTISPECIES: transketolase [unclassified Dyella]|uniref:transketolase n=1 Tax=unclassified Dyella TaxID=2634549 RepID=UPI000C83F146|nr:MULTISPECIES: transketolase [unclassified Dyella]MDR3444422.1 transketolase [Dyella sp.]PMQ05995.1 Transketolase 1 [Dyella sp. AD56]
MTTRRELANAVRALAMDAVEQANSGHPGMPMGMADIAEVLWNDFLQHNPTNPKWFNRDRFVLSNGHGSMLQYALLHLTGYDLPMDQLKRFRQLHSKTAGHPEASETPGVETTTGPLGQGLANAVGFALAEKVLSDHFNRPGHEIINHHTYVFLGDGCLMEGISHEVASLAGTWKLGKLVAVYDDNGISIDGEVHGWFTDNTPERFEAYGWNVIRGVDGHDAEAIKKAITAATSQSEKPTLICARTIIGFGAPHKQGKEESHGAALGKDEVAAARDELDWRYAPFEIPAEIYAGWDHKKAGAEREEKWHDAVAKYTSAFPELAAEFNRRVSGDLPSDWAQKSQAYVEKMQADGPTVASRKASQMAIEAFAPLLPELIGGSADLAGSNLTKWSGSVDAGNGHNPKGNYVYYGVREFGMTAIANGLALHGGFIPYDATFLVFSDYARNAVRMSALIPAHAIHVYTHDSIGLGEDGPTHQPVEHMASLRYIPNNQLWRPCDAVETAVSWKAAIERKGNPACLVFSRQNLKHQQRTAQQVADITRGAYVLSDPQDTKFKAILIATGSEVELAMEAARTLAQQNVPVRVVSMPCTELFDAQPMEYREAILPGWCRARVAVEAATSDFWRKYVGLDGDVVGMTSFGASAPAAQLFEQFGFTVTHVVDTVKRVIG